MTKKDRAARGIYRRGNRYWLNVQRDGTRHFIPLETGDYATAIRSAALLRSHPEINRGDGLATDAQRFIARQLRTHRYTRDTADSRGYVLDKFARFVQGKRTGMVTAGEVSDFYEQVRNECSESTAQTQVMTLRAFFSWASEVDHCARTNVAAEITLAKFKPVARIVFCTKELRDRLIERCPRADLKLVLMLGFHAGLRRKEIVEARSEWFSMAAREIHVQRSDSFVPKHGKHRKIPMSDALFAFLSGNGLPAPFLLHPEVTAGKSRYRYNFEKGFRLYVKSQGCPWVTPHTMRHTFASLLATHGRPLFAVAKWLGDSVTVTERNYAKLAPGVHDTNV